MKVNHVEEEQQGIDHKHGRDVVVEKAICYLVIIFQFYRAVRVDEAAEYVSTVQ